MPIKIQESIQEMKNFWQKDIHEYDNIAEVKDMACTDIYELIQAINTQQDKLDKIKECYPELFIGDSK